LTDVWETVDRLIRDLGAIRAFVDEAEALPEAASARDVAEVRGAMDDATAAITRIFDSSEDGTIEAAWRAIARAQDTVAAARAAVASARSAHRNAELMGLAARAQAARARDRADAAAEQAARIQRLARPSSRAPHRPEPDPTDH
jgi:hypothetical protein